MIQVALTDLDRQAVHSSTMLGGDPSDVHVILAPTECVEASSVGDGLADELLRESLVVITAPFGTEAFELDARIADASALVLATDRRAADELRLRGVAAEHLQGGYHETLESRPTHESHDFDLVCVGSASARVERLIAGTAPLVWDRSCDIRLLRPGHALASGGSIVTDRRKRLSRSRLMLHVHEVESGSLPWPLVMDAVANHCAVLSEESPDSSPLVAFEHFVAAPLGDLPGYASALLVDSDRVAALGEAAYRFATSELHFTRLFARLLPTIDGAVAERAVSSGLVARHGSDRPMHAPPHRNDKQAGEDLSGVRSQARPDSTAADTDISEKTGGRRGRTGVGATRGTVRRPRLVIGGTDHAPDFETESTPAYRALTPEVSVVLTLFNYRDVVSEAIASAACSVGVDAEIIVVEDHSTDDSAEVVRALMNQQPWIPLLLVAKQVNGGLSAARNTGFELARSEYVFVLDADNLVYPNGLARLRKALEVSGADMAYGVIDCFGEEGVSRQRLGLLSEYPWDPSELVKGNYVDAMAMLRRSVWADLGGYDSWMDQNHGGWEDWDLWLALAGSSRKAEFVPTPVARYRVHQESMIAGLYSNRRAIAVDDLFEDMRSRHPSLF